MDNEQLMQALTLLEQQQALYEEEAWAAHRAAHVYEALIVEVEQAKVELIRVVTRREEAIDTYGGCS